MLDAIFTGFVLANSVSIRNCAQHDIAPCTKHEKSN